jgi:hypothetical protein
MGAGISAAIPIIIGPYKDAWTTTIDPKNFQRNFLTIMTLTKNVLTIKIV